MFWKRKSDKITAEVGKADYKYDVNRILYASDFANGFDEWQTRSPKENHEDFGRHEVTASLTEDESYSGHSSLLVSGRIRGWNGVVLDATKYLKESVVDYECRVWVKLKPDAASCIVHLSMEIISSIGGTLIPKFFFMDDYSAEHGVLSKYRLPVGTFDDDDINKPANDYPHNPKNVTAKDGWVLLQSKLHVRKSNVHSVLIYIETDDPGGENDIYIDDFVLLSGLANK
jgi:hypothetical protein